jgi:hypothetical protein
MMFMRKLKNIMEREERELERRLGRRERKI